MELRTTTRRRTGRGPQQQLQFDGDDDEVLRRVLLHRVRNEAAAVLLLEPIALLQAQTHALHFFAFYVT